MANPVFIEDADLWKRMGGQDKLTQLLDPQSTGTWDTGLAITSLVANRRQLPAVESAQEPGEAKTPGQEELPPGRGHPRQPAPPVVPPPPLQVVAGVRRAAPAALRDGPWTLRLAPRSGACDLATQTRDTASRQVAAPPLDALVPLPLLRWRLRFRAPRRKSIGRSRDWLQTPPPTPPTPSRARADEPESPVFDVLAP